jgi:L-rhamnose mutarotase
MAATDVNRRWQAEMAEFFDELDGRAPDEGFLVLDEVFHLEDQLVAARDRPADQPVPATTPTPDRSDAP